VLEVAPPPLSRRGAAAAAVAELSTWPEIPTAADLLHWHRLLRASTLAAMGITTGLPAPVTADWLADPAHWAELQRQLAAEVAAHAAREPLSAGLPTEAARAALNLPDRALVTALVRPQGPVGVMAAGGRLQSMYRRTSQLADQAPAAVKAVLADLSKAPFAAPEAGRLQELGLDKKAIAAAARAGFVLRITDQIVLAPGADKAAAQVLAGLPQPFSTAEARQALGTTRRVAIPLLEYLDRAKITERLPDDRRRLMSRP
jgi:selenocysteine-specific elongation factor